MAANQKNLHSSSLAAIILVFFFFCLVILSGPSSAARLLSEHQGLPPNTNTDTPAVLYSEDQLGAPMSAQSLHHGNRNLNKQGSSLVEDEQVFHLHPKGETVVGVTPTNKFGTWIFNMLPKGRMPPSAPSRRTNNLNN